MGGAARHRRAGGGGTVLSDIAPGEVMVAQAAREIRDGERVFVGMRLPLIAFLVAKRTHAPNAVGLFELGVVRAEPARELLYTMGDNANVAGAVWCARTVELMGLLQRGEVHAGFIGGAEIDLHGNLNTTAIGADRAHPAVQLPGSGGGADIASLAHRLIVIMPHDRGRLREKVDFVTSSGYGTGGDWRKRVGLPRGGPSVLITTLGVFRFVDGSAVLESYHPGASVERIRAETGWPLQLAPTVRETERPTDDVLGMIRAYDPQGFWTGRVSEAFVLFHRLDDPTSADVRREIVARGQKSRVDFQNVDSDEGRQLFEARGGSRVPAIWDGARLRVGRDAIVGWLDELGE